jgi:hypothetical protein
VVFNVGDGRSTRFWKDTWLRDNPLANQYPYLYYIVQRKQVLVSFMGQVHLNIGFIRALTDYSVDRCMSNYLRSLISLFGS